MLTAEPALSSETVIHLVRSDAAGVGVEMTLPEYKVSQKVIGDIQYDQIVIPDFGQSKDVGSPQVPLIGTLVGIPEEGKVILNARGLDYQSFQLTHDLAPAEPAVKQTGGPALNENVYKTGKFYPGVLAREGFTGYMKDQRVMQILFYPVQYNPVTREVRVYKRILAEVTFDHPVKSLSKRLPQGSPAGAYETLLRDSLLNYDSLHR